MKKIFAVIALLFLAMGMLFPQTVQEAALSVAHTWTALQTFSAGIVASTVTTSGSNGGIGGPEGTGAGLTFGATSDFLWPDSTLHCFHENYNNTDNGCATGTIAKGQATLTSGSVSSNTCQSAVTVSVSSAVSGDRVIPTYSGAPSAGDALLDVDVYAASGSIGFIRCNRTSASQTGTAVVLNWSLVR